MVALIRKGVIDMGKDNKETRIKIELEEEIPIKGMKARIKDMRDSPYRKQEKIGRLEAGNAELVFITWEKVNFREGDTILFNGSNRDRPILKSYNGQLQLQFFGSNEVNLIESKKDDQSTNIDIEDSIIKEAIARVYVSEQCDTGEDYGTLKTRTAEIDFADKRKDEILQKEVLLRINDCSIKSEEGILKAIVDQDSTVEKIEVLSENKDESFPKKNPVTAIEGEIGPRDDSGRYWD